MQTGWPAQPAANVARLAPGFVPRFSALAFGVALAATLAWCALVAWRTARNRPAIWKSLVLPAAGASLGWLLLMTLWLPMLDYARSLAPQAAGVRAAITSGQGCVVAYGLSRAQVAALMYHGRLNMVAMGQLPECDWVVADPDEAPAVSTVLPPEQWAEVASVGRPTDRDEKLLVLHRTGTGR